MSALAAGKARGLPATAVIAICAAIAMLEGYDIQSMGVAAPRLMPALHLGHEQAGWALSASVIGLAVGAMIGGRLADRIGRRPVLIASVLAFGLFSLATAAAGSFASLMAARIAVGLGLGGAMPNLIAVAAEVSAPARRTTVTTLVFSGMSFGGLIAAMLAGFVPELGWRGVFVVGGAAPLLLAPVIARLPETRPVHVAGEPRDVIGALHALFGQGRARATLALWAAYALTLLILHLMLNWLPMLAAAKGLPAREAPMAAMAFNLASLAGAPLLGLSVDRFGPRWPMGAGYAAMVLAMLALAGAAGQAILAASGLAGFLVIGLQFTLYGLAPAYYPAAARATGAGAAVAAGRLGSIAGPLIGGYLLKNGASAGEVVRAMAPIALAAGVAILVLPLAVRRTGEAA